MNDELISKVREKYKAYNYSVVMCQRCGFAQGHQIVYCPKCGGKMSGRKRINGYELGKRYKPSRDWNSYTIWECGSKVYIARDKKEEFYNKVFEEE